MKRLLFHVCDFKTDILDPKNYSKNAICLSEDAFVGSLGQWLYIFEYDMLVKNFNIQECTSGGAFRFISSHYNPFKKYKFESNHLEKEYRIHRPINIKENAIGVVKNFNILKGELSTYLNEEVIKREKMEFNV